MCRAVATYLKSIFEKVEHMCSSESQQPAEISLDELLKGRTRKEAARMYFETLASILLLLCLGFTEMGDFTAFTFIFLLHHKGCKYG